MFGQGLHSSQGSPDSALTAGAAVGAFSPLGSLGDAGLEELVGADVEKIGDFIQIVQLDAPMPIEKFVHPRLVVAEPVCQRFLGFMLFSKECGNVLPEKLKGDHRP